MAVSSLIHKIFIFIILVILIGCLFFIFAEKLFSPVYQGSKNQICFKANCFFVEVAKTESEKEQGLMFRTKLDPDKGMLFIFDNEGEYSFWMKNTLIPLDIIWMDKNYKIVFISKNIQPCLSSEAGRQNDCPFVSSGVNAKYVFEINGGTAEKIGLKVSDQAEFMP